MRILQLLEWELEDIIPRLSDIANQGFDTIQVGPLQPTKAKGEYWLKYQPTDFRIEDLFILEKLCIEAHKVGIKVVVDDVIRHLAGKDDGSLYPHEKDNTYFKNDGNLWLEPINGNTENRWECINRCFGIPAINYFNNKVQDYQISNLFNKQLMYADGSRIDMGKHIALPEEGCNYWKRLKDTHKDKILYAEMINVPDDLLYKYMEYTMCLCEARTVSHIWDKDKLVVFFESHDTYHFFGYTKHMTLEERVKEYANIVTNYPNTILYARPFDDLPLSQEVRNINRNN